MNCIVPPIPSPRTCYEFGQAVQKIIENDLPDDLRIAFIGTGGLSHDPGGPKYFDVDEEFDRWFLGLLEEGDPERVLRECTPEKMSAPATVARQADRPDWRHGHGGGPKVGDDLLRARDRAALRHGLRLLGNGEGTRKCLTKIHRTVWDC